MRGRSTCLAALPQSKSLFPTSKFRQTGFQFGARKVPGCESGVALTKQALVEGQAVMHLGHRPKTGRNASDPNTEGLGETPPCSHCVGLAYSSRQ